MPKPLEIRKSKISKNGVFALKKIFKGQTICVMTGVLCSLDEMIENVDSGKEGSYAIVGISQSGYNGIVSH